MSAEIRAVADVGVLYCRRRARVRMSFDMALRFFGEMRMALFMLSHEKADHLVGWPARDKDPEVRSASKTKKQISPSQVCRQKCIQVDNFTIYNSITAMETKRKNPTILQIHECSDAHRTSVGKNQDPRHIMCVLGGVLHTIAGSG